MENCIVYNSWDNNFKAPFGALNITQSARITVKANENFDINKVELILDKEDENLNIETIRKIELKLDENREDGVFYTGEILPLEEQGIYYYYFEVDANISGVQKKLLYGKSKNNGFSREFCLGNLKKKNFYQLTVYKEYKVPSWFKEGVLYHIFVDRFNNGNRNNKIDNPKNNSFIYSNWDDDPMYIKDNEGKILRWDFYGGNIKGIINKLGYLKRMGVTIIYLSPVFESRSNHKYDTGDYKKIDPMFGDEKIFKELIDKAKEKGINVILDGVFSHVGADSVYFNKYNSYDSIGAYQSKDSKYSSWFEFEQFPDEYTSWWGVKDLPDVDELDKTYMDYIIYDKDSVIHKWMDMGVKGWRLDVADELPTKFIQELKKEIRKIDDKSVLVGEVWEDASNKVSYSTRRDYLLGEELDSVLGYPFRDNLLKFLKGEIPSWKLNDFFIKIKDNYPKEAFKSNLNLLGTHDVPRIKTELNSDEELLKLAILTQTTFEGVPYIYYGDEAGLEGQTDPQNRKTYPWKNENKDILDFYRHCIQFRNRNKVISDGDTFFIYAENDDVFAYIRKSKKYGDILVLMNRSCENQSINIDIDSEKIEEIELEYSVNDSGVVIEKIDGKFEISIDKKSYKLYKLI